MDVPELEYKQDAPEAFARLEAWWRREILDRPAFQVCAPRSTQPLPEKRHATVRDRWLDVDYVVDRAAIRAANTYWGGELLPSFWPNLGPEILTASLGAELVFGEQTSWSVPMLSDWDRIPALVVDRSNPYVRAILEMTRQGLEVGRGRFLVGLTDLHPGGDLAASLRDPQQLCLDLVLQPERVHELMAQLRPSFYALYELQYELMREAGQRITTSWLPLAASGRYYIPSCDFSCMISTDCFREFFLPEIIEEIEWLDRSIYHLDGPQALRHLDLLLEIDRLDAVQWVWGEGRGPASCWMPVFQRVQAAGKALHISIEPWELDSFMDALRPEGVMLSTTARSPEEADALLARVSRWPRRGAFLSTMGNASAMKSVDFEQHNAEVTEVWEAYRRGQPKRVPIIFGINPRYTMFDHPANPRGFSFEQFFSDPQVMLERQLEHQEWVRLNVPQDAEMGLPSEGWDVAVNFLNSYEAAWFGCELHYYHDQIPDTAPILSDERTKWRLFDQGIPDPFTGGLMRKNWEFYDYLIQKQARGWTWRGLPIRSVTPCGLGTDGPLTVACNLRGATEFMTDLAADPEYARQLLEFITEATITRIRVYRQRLGQPLKHPGWGFADDSVQLISTRMYEETVLPFHRRLVETFSEGGAIGMHLCGDSTRHFSFLRDALNVRSFDTGYPVDFRRVRQEVGPAVEILGGPPVAFLQTATPEDVRAAVRAILASGVTEGGRFILREANNLPPGVPLANLKAVYEAGKEYGRWT